ncbi:hypothetical protein MTBBW1_2490005 [Desulfamplus magnetovallimortis]|uniref:Uncharacterized protein n=1 Tax=Desulfamplus magnetovallimortis TaxID=1246637 RepID=A0A1W1HEL3_9BACT|nr:hypothetical protein [Desulfamplus magnetovallimortis]SLM30828.1 hypothetical protein MTBBW1_2490005 [Desulfamplus magnetovallimortis]
MKYQYFDSIWCDNEFYEVPFDRIGICTTPQTEALVSDVQAYIKAHEWVDDVTLHFHYFDLLKGDDLTDEFPLIESSHLVINAYGYSLRLYIDENRSILVEAY